MCRTFYINAENGLTQPDKKLLEYRKIACTGTKRQRMRLSLQRDMQGLAARFFGGRSAAEPGLKLHKYSGC